MLVAPDSFKGTFGAGVVADQIAAGLAEAGLAADRCPVADGGEGTAAVLLAARGGALLQADATGPLGRPVRAGVAVLEDGGADGPVAVVEVAAASGLGLVAEAERDAVAASSRGTGELVLVAVEAGARRVLVAAGGSATTDGGAGAIDAIGDPARLRGAELVVLSDVRIPFERAAAVFGPQKGADPATVELLAARLDAFAQRLPRDPRGVPGSGAAGGLAGGLWAAYGARIEPGAPYVLDAVGFDARLEPARAVVTGEGRIDDQSLHGKVPGEIIARARAAGRPWFAVVGADGRSPQAREQFADGRVVQASTLAEIAAAGREIGGMCLT